MKVTIETHESRNRYRLRWTHNGERFCFTPKGARLNPLGHAIAIQAKADIEFTLQAGTFDREKFKRDGAKPKAIITPSELVIEFAKSKLRKGTITERTKSAHYDQLAIALDRELNLPCYKVNRSHAESFASACNGLSKGVAKQRLWLVRSAWEWGQGRYNLDPKIWSGLAESVKGQPKRPVPKPFTVEEIRSIKTAFDGSKYRDIVILLFATAARPGEVFGLRWCDVSEDFKTIWIRNAVSRGVATQTTKTGICRRVPLTNSAAQALRDRHQKQDSESLVFPGVEGQPIKDMSFRSEWRRHLIKAGIEYRSPRNIRPSVITLNRLHNPGLDPVSFAETCGHSLRVQDAIYRRATDSTTFLDL